LVVVVVVAAVLMGESKGLYRKALPDLPLLLSLPKARIRE